MSPDSSMPELSSSAAAGSACGCGADCGFRSFVSMELIIDLKSSNLSAGILRPFFVGPVYCSLCVNSLMSTPVFPLNSLSPIMISVVVPCHSPFDIFPISFSMFVFEDFFI